LDDPNGVESHSSLNGSMNNPINPNKIRIPLPLRILGYFLKSGDQVEIIPNGSEIEACDSTMDSLRQLVFY